MAPKFVLLLNAQTFRWAVVVAQLAEQLLLIPEVCGSKAVIGKKLLLTYLIKVKKTKIKKKM